MPLDDKILLVNDLEIVQFLFLDIAVINVISFLVCVYDKHMSKKGGWRVSEKTLWILSLSGGAAAMLLAMKLVRHKTKHTKFMVGIPLILFLQIILFVYVIKYFC